MPRHDVGVPDDSGERLERWLLLRYHALGDVVLSTGIAVAAALGGGGRPPVKLDVAVDARFLPVYIGNPHIGRLWDRRKLEEQASGLRYDRVLDLQGTIGSRRLASRLSDSLVTVRTRSMARRWLVFWGDRFPRPAIPHCLARFGEALPGFSDTRDLGPRLWVTEQEIAEAAREAPEVFDLPPGRAVLLIPGASRRSKEYRRFNEVCRELLVAGLPVWWILPPGASDPPIERHPGTLSLRLGLGSLKAVFARAAAAVTCDSGPMHLAQGIGLPVVALFCSTDPVFGFAPLGNDACVLRAEDLACRPCGVHGRDHCWLGHWRCVSEVEPSRVVRETLRLLEQSRGSRDTSEATEG